LADELIQGDQLLPALTRDEIRLIDVRAPVEFNSGAIPGSVNLPILNDSERDIIGITYKHKGAAAAVALGHEIVCGEIKRERVRLWCQAIEQSKVPAVFTCFRGGMRSRLAQEWTRDAGLPRPRLDGGYKGFRHVLIGAINAFERPLIVLTGKTGAGKTMLLRETKRPNVCLESLAKHRGSAFGAWNEPQPSQSDFENRLAIELTRHRESHAVVVEDESRLIGGNCLPESFFQKMRAAPVVVLDEPLEVRVENTLKEYVIDRRTDPKLFRKLYDALDAIQRRLGGLRHREVFEDMRKAQFQMREGGGFELNRVWIEKLLVWYYDPLYESSFVKRAPKELVRGERAKILDFLAQRKLSSVAASR
jgi:tRNA 2-selenouridine synthase